MGRKATAIKRDGADVRRGTDHLDCRRAVDVAVKLQISVLDLHRSEQIACLDDDGFGGAVVV